MTNNAIRKPALLALEDGTLFYGQSFGAEGVACGQLVLNRSMTDYQEALSDPAYSDQLVAFTYPHIGNVGVNSTDCISAQISVAGIIVRHYPRRYSSWRAEQDLASYLQQLGVLAISNIDTRKLTRILREKGALSGAIQAGELDEAAALAAARAFAENGIKV